MSDQRIRVSVRSGHSKHTKDGRIRAVFVDPAGPYQQPTLWLGEPGNSVGYISGRDTLRKLRDALAVALGETTGLASTSQEKA